MQGDMLFGLYAPSPHITVGSNEITRSVKGALSPLPDGEVDPAFTLARDVLCAADAAGFDLCLYAERHLGADFEAWMLAAAISSWTRNIRAMPAVHPGLWHPTLIAKMASCLDRLTTGRMAINVVTGWNEVEARMYGGDILLHEDDRYIRAEEFIHVLRGMWSKTPFTFDGQFYQVKESQLLLKPATPSPPEIFTASRSERGLEMVAKYADWWFLDYDKSAADVAGVEDSLRRAIDGMSERAAKYGRKVRYAFNPFIAFGASHDAAIELGEGTASTTWVAGKNYVGWEEKVHGGLLATLLDEGMAWAPSSFDSWAVTAEISVRYRSPANPGEELTVTDIRARVKKIVDLLLGAP